MGGVLGSRRRRPRGVVPPLLRFPAGFIDSFTVLAVFGLFVAQVTGSFVLAAAAMVTNEQGALTNLLAIPVFLLAAVTTTIFAVMLERRGRAALAWVLGLECAVLTGFLLTALIGRPLANPNAASVTAASLLGLFAMGTQSATVRLLMKDVASTNVMTTNTTQIGIDATELLLACQASSSSVASMPICVVFVVITLVEATSFINRRTVALCVPMANRPSRLAAVTLAALGLASGLPINAVSRKPVNTAHSNPSTHVSAARPRRSSRTARMLVATAASRNTGIASSFVSAPCSFVTMAAAASTKLPVTCATNSPNTARTVKLSMKPAGNLRSGGTTPRGRRRREPSTPPILPPPDTPHAS